jgi:hypothetical protein
MKTKATDAMISALYVLEKALSPPSHTQWLADREETIQELRSAIASEEEPTDLKWPEPTFSKAAEGIEAAHGITAKPMFADLIAAHEGLAEELRAVDNIKES